MAEEIERGPERVEATGETRNMEEQELQDAAIEPRTSIEQSGDIRQAEQVQEEFTAVVGNTEQQVGHQPDVAQDVGATPLPIPRPEDGSYTGSLPEVRDDLDQATFTAKDTPSGEKATPIPLPGDRAAMLDPDKGPKPPSESSQPTMQAHRDLNQETDLEHDTGLLGPEVPGLTGLPGEDSPDSQAGLASRNLSPELGDAGISIDDMLEGASGKFQGFPGEETGTGAIHPKYGVGAGNPGSLVSEDTDDTVGGSDGFREDEEQHDYRYSDQALYESELALFDRLNEREAAYDAWKADPTQENLDAYQKADYFVNIAQSDYDKIVSLHENKMPRPDGSDSEGDAKNVDPTEVKTPSEKISDPAYTQGMGIGSGGFENTKHPNLVTDPAEWQDGGKPSTDARTTSGSEQVSDPAEPEDGPEGSTNRSAT